MADPETRAEAAEAAAIRRRWITLGEILAVIAVLISGLTLWNSYSERSASEAERAQEKQRQAARSRALVLKADGGRKRLNLAAVDPAQAIQSQTIAFPSALGVKTIETLIEPRIEAGWIEKAAKKARDAGAAGKASGDLRLPVAIGTRFVAGGETFEDIAIYDVGYRREGSLLGGSDVDLLGLSLVERVPVRNAQAQLDSLWNGRLGK
jgi:hypothetical protein